ncbi:MAG: TA system VapC family ribonuclease toxin [Vicinamibacterales bacterium]
MVAVDTNLLVYAHRADSAFHTQADRVVADLAEGRASWAIPWPCLYEFYAIVTHPKIYRPATPAAEALVQIGYWLESPSLVLLHEGDGFFDALGPVLAASKVQGGAVHDARIAALCLRNGVKTLLSADRDFSRFPQLRTENPLSGLKK